MNNQQTEIVALFETQGMSIEAIAGEQGVSENAVKAVLLQYSRVYKTAHRKLDNEYISDEMLRRLYEDQFILATEAESPVVRMKSAQFLINDKRGRLDVVKEDSNNKPRVNVNVIQVLLQKANEQKQKALGNDRSNPTIEAELVTT